MALLQRVTAEDIDNKQIKEFYNAFRSSVGAVPETLHLALNSQGLFEQQMKQIAYYRGHQSLSPELLTFIRYTAATVFKDQPCIDFNGALLKRQGMKEEELAAVAADPASAPLSEKEQPLLAFVVAGVKDQTSASAEKMEELRSLGWQDSDIYDAVNHGFFMFAPGRMMELFKMGK